MKLAGALRRGFAYIFDDFILSIGEIVAVIIYGERLMKTVNHIVSISQEEIDVLSFYKELFVVFQPFIIWTTVITFVVYMFYGVILPVYWNGQTVGRKIVGIRLVSTNNEMLTIKQMILRELVGKILWWLITLGLGVIVDWIMIGLRSDKRAIRDILAHTTVELLEGEYVKSEYDNF